MKPSNAQYNNGVKSVTDFATGKAAMMWMSFVKLADGREFWFLVSEHPDAVDVSLEGRDLTTLDGREASHLHLEPWGVQVVVRHNEENR